MGSGVSIVRSGLNREVLVAMPVTICSSLQTSLRESIATLKEENASLRTTLDQAPPTTHLETLKQQIRASTIILAIQY